MNERDINMETLTYDVHSPSLAHACVGMGVQGWPTAYVSWVD